MEVTFETNTKQETVNLRYLFFTFLKIGMVSFGGHMALISVIQREMAEKDKTVSAGAILDAVGIASLLPGPMAVNVVTYLGVSSERENGGAREYAGNPSARLHAYAGTFLGLFRLFIYFGRSR